jgi:hypothetical protein
MKPNRTKQVAGIVIGSLLLALSPGIAFLLHVFGMMRAFDTLGGPGIADPNRLSGDIHIVLYAWVGALAGSIIGLITLIVSMVLFVRAGRTSPPC